jgi:hypothetical protein
MRKLSTINKRFYDLDFDDLPTWAQNALIGIGVFSLVGLFIFVVLSTTPSPEEYAREQAKELAHDKSMFEHKCEVVLNGTADFFNKKEWLCARDNKIVDKETR